ncbi:hypothetical protein F5146DRAFT_1124258 [Armillaria mellea]|nr:hypothetical protein F5146DRAFT_1124258 [Armillaria mellea]
MILDSHAYSMGGPTGEIHMFDPATGTWKQKIQEILFVKSGKLAEADKTRKALRYGSHAIEFTCRWKLWFCFGSRDVRDPGLQEGRRRHVKVHPDGEVVYSVTEHAPTPSLKLVSSQPLLYASGSAHSYRGDTLLLAPLANQIFATTRGATHLDPGYISVFSLSSSVLRDPGLERESHAINLLSKTSESTTMDQESLSVPAESVWIVLTDDDPCTQTPEPCASVRILEWNGWDTDVEEEFSEPSPLDTCMPRTDNSVKFPREFLPLSSCIPGGQYNKIRLYLQQNQSRANGSAARGDAKGKKLQRTPSHFWEGGRCDPSSWESNPAFEAMYRTSLTSQQRAERAE